MHSPKSAGRPRRAARDVTGAVAGVFGYAGCVRGLGGAVVRRAAVQCMRVAGAARLATGQVLW